MTLRERVVEAGARAESLHGFTEETQRLIAEDLLETFLDCLTEETADWQATVSPLAAGEVAALVYALREDR